MVEFTYIYLIISCLVITGCIVYDPFYETRTILDVLLIGVFWPVAFIFQIIHVLHKNHSRTMQGGEMTAEEARERSAIANNPNTGIVGELVKYAHTQIKKAAEKGDRSIFGPFAGLRWNSTYQQEELAYRHLASQGYKIDNHHEDGRSWVTISW